MVRVSGRAWLLVWIMLTTLNLYTFSRSASCNLFDLKGLASFYVMCRGYLSAVARKSSDAS